MVFVDDIAIVSIAKIEAKPNAAIKNVGAWLDESGLPIAAHKTEAVLISGMKIVKKMEVTIGGTRIESKTAIKYLGMIIDDRLNFKKHVKHIDEKASVKQRAQARMMIKFGGPGPFKMRAILGVLPSIMLRACPEALCVGTTRRILSSVYHLSANRRISA